jgi:hypothetical protein
MSARPTRRRACAGRLAALATVCAALAAPAAAAPPTGLVVVPRPAGANGLSYFRLGVRPGRSSRAGSIELRNPTRSTVQVRVSAVDGLTLSTLGSGYAPPGSLAHGSTTWVGVGRGLVTLGPRSSTRVPVTVKVPAGEHPGDFLSGVSVEALGQDGQGLSRKGVSIASASRYAIGVEVSVPGPRWPLIRFTGAAIDRQPAGLTFELNATNPGNVVLQGVHGHVLVMRGRQIVLSRAIEAGTFVSGTSISYPVTAFHQFPPEGTSYRISAWLDYRGGVARLDTAVAFGHTAAAVQQHYGHAPPPGAPSSDWWKILGVGLIALYALGTTILLLRRRSREARPAGQT